MRSRSSQLARMDQVARFLLSRFVSAALPSQPQSPAPRHTAVPTLAIGAPALGLGNEAACPRGLRASPSECERCPSSDSCGVSQARFSGRSRVAMPARAGAVCPRGLRASPSECGRCPSSDSCGVSQARGVSRLAAPRVATCVRASGTGPSECERCPSSGSCGTLGLPDLEDMFAF